MKPFTKERKPATPHATPDKHPIFSASDCLAIAFLILVGIFLSVWVFSPQEESGNYLEIRQNGSLILTLPLSTDTTRTINDQTDNTNTFCIQNGTVWMQSADCGDKTCLRTGKISQAGESIVCLPHRLVLQIVHKNPDASASGGPVEPDAITR